MRRIWRSDNFVKGFAQLVAGPFKEKEGEPRPRDLTVGTDNHVRPAITILTIPSHTVSQTTRYCWRMHPRPRKVPKKRGQPNLWPVETRSTWVLFGIRQQYPVVIGTPRDVDNGK